MCSQIHIDEKTEQDIQKLCEGVLIIGVEQTGDYGMGGACPFCSVGCCWNDSMSDIPHKDDCIYLIAKDLSTKF